MSEYRITTARPRDLPYIATIELAAARMLAGHVPASLLDEVTPLSVLGGAQVAGRLWVALRDDALVGFAHVEMFEPNVAHLLELDVHPDHGRQGIGRRLVTACVERARERHVLEVMAITSSDGFFRTCGFDYTLPGERKALFIQTREER